MTTAENLQNQRNLCADAASRAPVFMMAAFLRRKGIATYDDAMIASATGATLEAIKADLLHDYNAACGRKL